MKHLILGGGHQSRAHDGGAAWVRALLTHAGKDARIAFCLYARDEHEWIRVLEDNQALIRAHAGQTKLDFKTLTPENFHEVSEWANIIYLTGGDFVPRLKERLEQIPNLLNLWDGKTIAGSSAGADIIAERYLHLQTKRTEPGLGWITATLVPHWRAPTWPGWTEADWDGAAAQLASKPGEHPLLCLPEGAFLQAEVR